MKQYLVVLCFLFFITEKPLLAVPSEKPKTSIAPVPVAEEGCSIYKYHTDDDLDLISWEDVFISLTHEKKGEEITVRTVPVGAFDGGYYLQIPSFTIPYIEKQKTLGYQEGITDKQGHRYHRVVRRNFCKLRPWEIIFTRRTEPKRHSVMIPSNKGCKVIRYPVQSDSDQFPNHFLLSLYTISCSREINGNRLNPHQVVGRVVLNRDDTLWIELPEDDSDYLRTDIEKWDVEHNSSEMRYSHMGKFDISDDFCTGKYQREELHYYDRVN